MGGREIRSSREITWQWQGTGDRLEIWVDLVGEIKG
jgi:hypothetical protein